MKSFLIGSAAMGLTLAAVSPAFAAAADSADASQVDEVVVTAQRRSESVLKVPLAVSALSADTLAKAGVTSANGLSSLVPNLQVNSSFGNTQPNFSLRGISVGNEYNANQASPVGVYVDDGYLASRAFHGMQIYDLERVEVLRGPQGTLYGRNTTGGAINFITRGPKLAGDNGYGEVGYGNFNTVRAQGAFEHTFIADVLGVRGAFTMEKGDGQIKNLFPGAADPNSTDSVAGRIVARFKPNERFDFKLKVYGGRDNPTQAAVHGIGVLPGGANPIDGYSRGGLDFYKVSQENVGHNRVTADGAMLRADFTVSDNLVLSSLSTYDQGEERLHQDADGSPVNLLTIDWGSKFIDINQELRFTYTGERLNLIGGVYYGKDVTKTVNDFQLLYFLKDLGVPADPTLTAGGAGIFQLYRQVRESKAVFAQGDYRFNSQWAMTVGLRYTQDSASYEKGRAFITDYDNVTPLASTIPGPGPYTTAELPTRSHSGNATTGRIALTYTFDNGAIVYASASRGYRSGAFNGGGYLSPVQIAYVQPETVNAYEAGAKGHFFDRRLTLTAAVFHYDYRNQQIQEVVGPVAFLRNAGASRVDGAEAEFTARPAEAVTVTGSVGVLDTEYKDLTLAGVNLKGANLPFAPRLTGQLSLDWTVGSVAGGDVSIQPTVKYTGKQYFSPFNTLNGNGRLMQDAYAKVDLNLSWRRNRTSAKIWAQNLLQEDTYAYGLDLRSSFGYDFLVPAAPRTFGVTLRQEF